MKNYIANGQTHVCIDIPSLTSSLQRTVDGIRAKPSSAGLWKSVFDVVGLSAPMARRPTNTKHTGSLDRL